MLPGPCGSGAGRSDCGRAYLAGEEAEAPRGEELAQDHTARGGRPEAPAHRRVTCRVGNRAACSPRPRAEKLHAIRRPGGGNVCTYFLNFDNEALEPACLHRFFKKENGYFYYFHINTVVK